MGPSGKRDAVDPVRERLYEEECISVAWVLLIFKYTLATKLKIKKKPCNKTSQQWLNISRFMQAHTHTHTHITRHCWILLSTWQAGPHNDGDGYCLKDEAKKHCAEP